MSHTSNGRAGPQGARRLGVDHVTEEPHAHARRGNDIQLEVVIAGGQIRVCICIRGALVCIHEQAVWIQKPGHPDPR